MSVQRTLRKYWARNVFLLFDIILRAVKLFSLVCSKKIIFKLQCSYCSSISSRVRSHFYNPSYTGTLWLRLKSPKGTPDMSNDSTFRNWLFNFDRQNVKNGCNWGTLSVLTIIPRILYHSSSNIKEWW